MLDGVFGPRLHLVAEARVVLWGGELRVQAIRRVVRTSVKTEGFSRIICWACSLSDLYSVSFIHLPVI